MLYLQPFGYIFAKSGNDSTMASFSLISGELYFCNPEPINEQHKMEKLEISQNQLLAIDHDVKEHACQILLKLMHFYLLQQMTSLCIVIFYSFTCLH